MTKIERESINFKLPKTLTAALRKAARERNTTGSDLVIEGLHHVLGSVTGTENGIETRLCRFVDKRENFKSGIIRFLAFLVADKRENLLQTSVKISDPIRGQA